jgi:hypothetical protein
VNLGFTSFFSPAVTNDSNYAPFKVKFSEFGFTFGSPSDSQISLSDFADTSDQSAVYENGRITILPPWEEVDNETYLAWYSHISEAGEDDLEELMVGDIAQMDRSATIVGQGMINFMDPTTNKYIQGKYYEVNTESKQVMVGLWWCTGDDRDYILHLENGQAEMGIETLYLFQRYLISFHCQEPKTE